MWKTFNGIFLNALVELENASIFAPLLDRASINFQIILQKFVELLKNVIFASLFEKGSFEWNLNKKIFNKKLQLN